MEEGIRVAFFPDTYEEIDGVANTSRQFEAFARERGFELLIVCGGTEDTLVKEGCVTRVICRRGRFGFPLDKKHDFDLAFWRHYDRVFDAVYRFAPDIVHITGPSDVGQLGALVAHRLRVPLAASWHTNLHEYAERRALRLLPFLPETMKDRFGAMIREISLSMILRFYKIPRVLFAPNPELIDLLVERTHKPVHPMYRGVDTNLFTPARRDRESGPFTIGYVGRLTIEKNIHALAEIEAALGQAMGSAFRFSIVGQGAEEQWLRARMRHADFHGALRGEALARAYANMDVFVFPSRTDTFGNVVLEALASGVPAIVTNAGGPRFIVRTGETGFVAANTDDFVHHIRQLAADPQRSQTMRAAARDASLGCSWHRIFSGVYEEYRGELTKFAEKYKKAGMTTQPSPATPA
jgi:phosphatidylinositol alpha 1,6-mannosyltransferase